MAQIKWKLVDENAMEVFSSCFGCGEPGVQTLTKGGTYTLTVGADNDPATGTYQLRLTDVPLPSQFSIKIGDTIKENFPGTGAGIIESSGAKDIYTFTAAPRQRVYFHRVHHSTGMAQIKWKLVDENAMEVFSSCFGCSEPGVQTLTKGGTYTLTVGADNDPATGDYTVEIGIPQPN